MESRFTAHSQIVEYRSAIRQGVRLFHRKITTKLFGRVNNPTRAPVNSLYLWFWSLWDAHSRTTDANHGQGTQEGVHGQQGPHPLDLIHLWAKPGTPNAPET